MRHLFGFLCVCALGLMPLVGCSETAGDGGSGGDGGNGGAGGGVATDCTDAEPAAACTIGDVQGLCFEDECLPTECEGLEEGTECFWTNIVVGGGGRGFCEGGTCTSAVEDCTGLETGTPCRSDGMVNFICVEEQCAALDCSDLEDGTTCTGGFADTVWLNACGAGECVYPEDCTGIADGVLCTGVEGGTCEAGECVSDP